MSRDVADITLFILPLGVHRLDAEFRQYYINNRLLCLVKSR